MTGRSVVHVVRSDAFAGVERYVCAVVSALSERGWRATVVGGDPASVRGHLPADVEHVSARTTAEVARALVRRRPDLVHAHMTAADVAAAVTRPVTRATLASTRHFPAARGAHPVVRRLVRPLLAGFAVRIAISEYVARAGGDRHEHVLLHGIADRPLVPVADRAPEVLLLQRLEPEKDAATAVRAWADCSLPSRGWTLLVAGDGSQRAALQVLAERLGVRGSVRFLGFVADPAPVLVRAGALLAPTPVEAFGLAVVEAMASGTPVVAAGSGGHLEVLGDAGWYFAPGDVAACAAQLDRLADDPSATAAYGASLRGEQQRRLSLERHVDVLERLYLGALGGAA